MKNAQLAVKFKNEDPDHFVVGFDISGDETKYPIYYFKDVIKYAKNNHLFVTIHAGEVKNSGDKARGDRIISGSESVHLALDYGADSIGHGVNSDKQEMEELKDKNIILEVCPTSNVATGNATWKDHPIRKLLDNGVKVSVCTNDSSVVKTNLSKEWQKLYKYGIVKSWNQIKEITLNGAKGAFLPKEEKKELVDEFEHDLQKIEKDPYFKRVIDKFLTPVNNNSNSNNNIGVILPFKKFFKQKITNENRASKNIFSA